MNTVSTEKKLSLYQVVILCGTREEKHSDALARETGTKKRFVATWPSRGIPHIHWTTVSRLAGISIPQICDAQAFVKDITYDQEYEAYFKSMQREQAKSVDTADA